MLKPELTPKYAKNNKSLDNLLHSHRLKTQPEESAHSKSNAVHSQILLQNQKLKQQQIQELSSKLSQRKKTFLNFGFKQDELESMYIKDIIL